MLAALAAADRLRDQLGQLAGARNRLRAAARDDRARDAPAQAFLAELPERVGYFGFAGASKEPGSAFAAGRIHAHVERRIGLEAEPARRIVELRRRHAEVEQHAVQ